jgi:hypothetical protein
MLFGPGVNSITTAKRRKAARSERDMGLSKTGFSFQLALGVEPYQVQNTVKPVG